MASTETPVKPSFLRRRLLRNPAEAKTTAPSVSRGHRVPATMIPVTIIITVALMLLLDRVFISDWQGLVAETRQRLDSSRPAPEFGEPPAALEPQIAAALDPAKLTDETRPAAPAAAAEPPAPPAPELSEEQRAVGPAADPLVEGAVEAEGTETKVGETPELAAGAAAPPDTAQAINDIQQEAERRKAEQAELERLREEAAANIDANPPAPPFDRMIPFFGGMAPADRAAREAWIRQRAQVERRMLEQMATQQRQMRARMEAFLREVAPPLGNDDWPPRDFFREPMPPAPQIPFGELPDWGIVPQPGRRPGAIDDGSLAAPRRGVPQPDPAQRGRII